MLTHADTCLPRADRLTDTADARMRRLDRHQSVERSSIRYAVHMRRYCIHVCRCIHIRITHTDACRTYACICVCMRMSDAEEARRYEDARRSLPSIE